MSEPEPISLDEGRAMVKQRALGRCEVGITTNCRIAGPVDHHHRQRREGGDHRPSNGIAACRDCHRYIHANPAESWANGWICTLLGQATPASVPVLLHPRGEAQAAWVLLSEGGTYL